ncbi:MAG: 4Fe-4S dicluster domain-containing protein [Armatimonadota bacterium]
MEQQATHPTEILMLPADRIRRFIKLMIEATDHFVAPKRSLHEDVVFAEVEDADEVELDYENALVSPACFVLPQREAVFTYAMAEGEPPEVRATADVESHIIFGVRPCDVAAIEYLDRFFMGGEFADDVYARRREAKTIVAMACVEPQNDACWCTCSNAGPVARSGYDLQLTPMDDSYLVEVGSERGERLAEIATDLLEDADEELVEERERQVEAAYETFERRGNIAQAMRWISSDETPEELWEELGAKCFSCGSCSLVCPVCSCFDTHEYIEDGVGARIRCWDSCHFPGYSLEASGFNPREDAAERMFHYAHHKLCGDTFQKYDRPGCVGCGRCVQVCSAQIDLPRIAQTIRERGWECKSCPHREEHAAATAEEGTDED